MGHYPAFLSLWGGSVIRGLVGTNADNPTKGELELEVLKNGSAQFCL